MIIKGNPAGNVDFWSNYLLNPNEHERAELKEIRGLAAGDLPSALREMEAMASGSRSHGNFMYQANINPRTEERLTEEQWTIAADTLERNLGLEGHQRIVVEHEEKGRTHRHVIWNRVDGETGKVADMGGNYRIHEKTSRELEERFGLTPTPTPDKSIQREPTLEIWEARAAERNGIDLVAMKAELTDLWRTTDSGKAFAAAIEERGYILVKGDSRDFCIIDQAGKDHSLARRLEGVNVKELRARMSDVDRDALPTVAEGRSIQRAIGDHQPSLGSAAGEVRLAWSLSRSPDGFAASLESRGLTTARVDAAEAAASMRVNAFAKEIGNYAPRYAEGEIVVVNSFGTVVRLDERTTGQPRSEIDKALGTIDQAALLNVTDARAVVKEAARLEFYEQRQTGREMTPIEQRIETLQREAVSAGAFSAAMYREGITIARADGAGIEGLARDQRAAFQDDKQFFGPTLVEGELVAVNTFGGVHRLNPMKLDLDGIELALSAGNKAIPALGYVRDTIETDRAADQKVRDQKASEFWGGYRERKDTAAADRMEKWQTRVEAERGRGDRFNPGRDAERSALVVVGVGGKVAGKLLDIVSALLGDSGPRSPPEFTSAGQMEQMRAQRRARAAMENIRDDMEAGKGLKVEDIQNLTPSHLENIRLKGDDYVRSLIASMERNRPLEYDYGRTRER